MVSIGASRFTFRDGKVVGISIHIASLPNARFDNGIGFDSKREEVLKAFGEPIDNSKPGLPEFDIAGTRVRFHMSATPDDVYGKSIAIKLTRHQAAGFPK